MKNLNKKFIQIKKKKKLLIKLKIRVMMIIANPQNLPKKIWILMPLIVMIYLTMKTNSKFLKNLKFLKPYQLKPLEPWLF